ncbi:hypothetical protein T492DRAFT_397079 [Pavlovales sp. CCMP2436]|nr:hypothetical protein T492DRAFT_397079 [Pavlovales sp. CCMP2436]
MSTPSRNLTRPLKDWIDFFWWTSSMIIDCIICISKFGYLLQGAYEQAEQKLHAALERLDAMLASSKFVAGAQFTEADVRLLPTIARFDGMYATLFRCGRKTVRADYSNIHRWLCEVRRLLNAFVHHNFCNISTSLCTQLYILQSYTPITLDGAWNISS